MATKKKTFAEQLESMSGLREIVFVVPYPFLPPRFLADANERNLLIHVDTNLQITARWEGARREVPTILTPKAAARLLEDVARRVDIYVEDSLDMADFVADCEDMTGTEPEPDYRTADPGPPKEDESE